MYHQEGQNNLRLLRQSSNVYDLNTGAKTSFQYSLQYELAPEWWKAKLPIPLWTGSQTDSEGLTGDEHHLLVMMLILPASHKRCISIYLTRFKATQDIWRPSWGWPALFSLALTITNSHLFSRIKCRVAFPLKAVSNFWKWCYKQRNYFPQKVDLYHFFRSGFSQIWPITCFFL